MIPDLLELVGSICEITGALLMANALLGLIVGLEVPLHLLSALVQGKRAKGLARMGGLTPENHGQSLRGLAFIALGFVLKFLVIVWKLLVEINTPAGH